MNKTSFNTILSGSIWGILAKIIDAASKFVTIPLLVGFYGKADYGLIALAFSLNAYLRLMDMGMNIGSVRFFSMWISQNEWEKIGKVSRSSIVFYGVVGIINALIFVYMGNYSASYFKLTPDQLPLFRWVMYTLALSTIFNWTSNVISQLLTANGQLAWINKVIVISSVLNFLTAYLAIKLNLPLPTYFILYTVSTLVIIPLNIYKLKTYKLPILSLITPKWDKLAFKEIMGYSMAIFAMSIFQFSADNLRPILLGKYASKGLSVLTDYRVIQTVAMLIIAFGGVFLDALLPSASKIYAENDQEKISNMVFKGTKYISVFLCYIVFILITNSKILLTLYMGPAYSSLSLWLIWWLLTVLLLMHNTPVASLVLSSGKTRAIVMSSAVACFISLPITIYFAPLLNVGAAVVGYSVYIVIQMITYYFYYTPVVLKLQSSKLFFGSFFPSVLIGIITFTLIRWINQYLAFGSNFKSLIGSSFLFTVVFTILTLLIVLKPTEIRELKNKILSNN